MSAVSPTPDTTPAPSTPAPTLTSSIQQTTTTTVGSNNIPLLSKASVIAQFARLRSDYHTVTCEFNFMAQEDIASATYLQIEQLAVAALEINRVDFIRVWKTLILKRLIDVYEQEYHTRHGTQLRLSIDFLVPRPLGDLLYSIGQYHSSTTGVMYHITPPAPQNPPQAEYGFDAPMLSRFQRTILRNKSLYMMSEFPRRTDYSGTPLMLCAAEDATTFRRVKACSSEVTQNESFLVFVNNAPMFATNAPAFANCHFDVCETMYRAHVINEYVGSYVLNNNS